jgi:putative nucleotidyltransferase with HDIG domain
VDAVDQKWVAPEDREATRYRPPQAVRYINKVPAQDEHRKALSVYRASKNVAKGILDGIRLMGVIDTKAAKATVDDCVNSILRNPDALLWMSKMRDVHEYTTEHSLNVCVLAVAFGRHLGMEEDALQKLGLCGLLHDVGKMRIPPEVLNKVAALSDKEFKMIKAHTVHGRNLLMSTSGLPGVVVDVAYSHHEKVDGTGYPRKLKASGISDFARIIAIVDAYDAMTAERCYAPARSSTDALKIIFKDRGSHFDERLALEFIKAIGLYPPGSIVELVNGSLALILTTNVHSKHLPKIILIRNEEHEEIKQKIVNLSGVADGSLDRGFLISKIIPDGTHGIYLRDFLEQGLRFGNT